MFKKLYMFSDSPVSKSPDSKIPTLSEAMRGQNVTKLDLLARNEAVEVETRENLYKGASYDNPKLMLCIRFSSSVTGSLALSTFIPQGYNSKCFHHHHHHIQ